MKTRNKKIMIICLIFSSILKCWSQEDDNSLLNQVSKDDQSAVDAIAMYPKDVRKNIFTACMYPEIIVRLNTMQKKTNAEFTDIISSYSKEEQEKIYNLTRYPDLITQLAADHKKSKSEIKEILKQFPEEIHQTALEEGVKNYDMLVRIDQNSNQYSSQFDAILRPYPQDAVNAFKELVKTPEILSTLTDNMQLTVIVGDIYKRNPQLVQQKTDSLNTVLSQQNTKEAADWQQSLSNDPQAQKEYEQAAQDYAHENGYETEEYITPRTEEAADYYTYSYNWWFGYPYWCTYSYWDPYPYWYDWGFYYGPHHHPYFIGMPSSYFLSWYFYDPEHHYNYPELSNHYYNYYYGHRSSVGSNNICRSVNDWRTRNKDIVNDEWEKDPAKRTQLFKEYGKMEMDRKKYNKENPEHMQSRAEFLQNHQDKYTNIKVDTNVPVNKMNYTKQEPQPRVMKHHIKIPDTYNAKETPDNSESAKPERRNEPPANEQRNNNSQDHSYKQINNAQDNHRSSWQQMQQSQPEPRQTYQAPPRQISQPTSPPKRR